MFELSLNKIHKFMGTNLILKDVNINVYENDRVGIVGANGSGKSTILKLIAGIIKLKLFHGSWSAGYDFGWIALPKNARVAYLDQVPSYDESYKVIDVLNLAFKQAFDLEKEMRILEGMMSENVGQALEKILKEYEKTSQLYELNGGYETHEKMSKICSGLGFDDVFLQKDFSLLSGGEKTTVELGKLLMHNPDILLLDEPTNHLDTLAIEWLENYLLNYKGIIITVSHDRYFLDAITNKIVEIEDLTTITYKGNYSSFVEQKDEAMRIQFENYKEQKKQMDNMKKQIQELRAWALKADNNKFFKRAASIQIKLNKMAEIKNPIYDRENMKFNLKANSRSGQDTIIAYDIKKSYDDKVIFDDASFMVKYGERVGLIGGNGSGKSTLLKMLLKEENLDSGTLEVGSNSKVGYLPQEVKFKNEKHTVVECFKDEVVIEEGKAREYLAKYMFFGQTVFTEVGHLSGGERIRLKLAKLLYQEVNLLILDEPTNHLDINSIETFESALEDFNGTLLFVSHDRYFINKVSKSLIAIENRKLVKHDCNYDSYRKLLKDKTLDMTPVKKEKKKVVLKKEIEITSPKKIEDEILSVEKQLIAIDLEMNEIGNNYEILGELYEEREILNHSLEALWLTYENIE